MRSTLTLTLLALISIFPTVTAAPTEEIVRGTDEFEFVYRAKLPTISQAGRIWLPLAKTGPWQTVTIERISSPRETRTVHDRAHQNDIPSLPFGARKNRR